jgi:hypothetical protein
MRCRSTSLDSACPECQYFYSRSFGALVGRTEDSLQRKYFLFLSRRSIDGASLPERNIEGINAGLFISDKPHWTMKESPRNPQIEERAENCHVSEYERIARIAYIIWLSEDQPIGCAEEHWRQAESLHIGARLICANEN